MKGGIARGANERRRFAASVIAREVLRELGGAFAKRGIPLMPLKGALFQLILYSDPTERSISDVDVLVPERHFAEAIAISIALGYRPLGAGPSWIEATLMSPHGLPLDLHQRMFCSWRYRMPTDDVFRRASLDAKLIGVPIWIPDPHDIFAHLVGKFVSDHVAAAAEPRLRELARVAAFYQLQPARTADHLLALGLGRAARHVLARAQRELGDPFFATTLRELPSDRVGAVLDRFAGACSRHLSHSPLAPVSAHMLNSSLPRGATSLTLAFAYAARHAYARLTKGAHSGHWTPFFAGSSNSALRKASSARAS